MTSPGQTSSSAGSAIVTDRYQLVGLSRNPFAVNDLEHDTIPSSAAFVPRGLDDPPPPGSRTLVQVIGDEGAGKTTHVRYWRHLTPGPYHYIPMRPYRLRWHRPPVAAVVYADEIDRMPRPLRWWWLRRLAKAGATVVAGTHLDLTTIATRAGLQVITHHLGPIDRQALDAIIAARLRSAALSQLPTNVPEPTTIFDEHDLDGIYERCGGSVREAEIRCHELLAERVL